MKREQAERDAAPAEPLRARRAQRRASGERPSGALGATAAAGRGRRSSGLAGFERPRRSLRRSAAHRRDEHRRRDEQDDQALDDRA